jgi:ATP-dependent Zn protease
VPDIAARKEILEYYFSKHKKYAYFQYSVSVSHCSSVSKDVNVDIIARQTAGKTGAELENLVNLAAINSIKEKKIEIGMLLVLFLAFIFT